MVWISNMIEVNMHQCLGIIMATSFHSPSLELYLVYHDDLNLMNDEANENIDLKKIWIAMRCKKIMRP